MKCLQSLLFTGLLVVSPVLAQEAEKMEAAPDPAAEAVQSVRDLYHKGDYKEAIKAARAGLEDFDDDRRFVVLEAKSLLAEGKYEEAIESISDEWIFEDTQEGQMLYYDIKRAQGDFTGADDHLSRVLRSRRFSNPMDLLEIGRAAILAGGGEPKDILKRFYKRVQKLQPNNADVHRYIGNLALEKYDYEMAAESFDQGLQLEPNNTDLRYALAKTFFESDRKHAMELLEKNLEENPRHIDSLLLSAQHHLLAELEDKSEAISLIERAEAVNEGDARPNAMRAVMALIEADEEKAESLRQLAKKGRVEDPRIDYHIGEWMASLMRFQEAVPYLRAALETEPEFLPAKIALGQNLLRTGEEDEAWLILEGVSDRDQYNVAVYNLLALHDEIEDYETINRKNFIVRMESAEAKLYGDRVVALLEKGEAELHAKYDFKPSKPILVEFFPNQEDFAVRTFGFMGGDGFLGACFGLVVTMNSPGNGATGKTNWESTLWHEYCHAVTLGATKNRMPRWLTEGLSVYEERRLDPTCGHQLNLDFRRMILQDDELIPLGQLNYGFLRPKSGLHMEFAYYQSSAFIDYFMENFGEEALRAIIRELRRGAKFSEACNQHAEPLEDMEKAFFAFIKQKAQAYGGAFEWEVPDENLGALSLDELAAWTEKHPKNYYGARALASALIEAERYDEAETLLNEMVSKFPEHGELGSPYELLVRLYSRTENKEKHRKTLTQLVAQAPDRLESMSALLDYEAEAGAWETVETLCHRIMAINPYITKAQKALAESYVARDQKLDAVTVYERLLTLKPRNPAQVHFAIASLLRESEPARAKLHTLDALAEAPRYREALQLLRELSPSEEPS
ncbi:MAG: tetratricopeptide repeat protein [Verrucomicrobiales bacterium]|nr:tetratricopeptide repeat protein [Verrucomicrobiales bacterium]